MLLPSRTNSFFDDFFNDSFFDAPELRRRDHSRIMSTDVKETESEYLLDIELPGYKKEDIKAELKEGYLTISANHEENNEEKDDKKKYIRRERFVGHCRRTFFVGKSVKQEDIKASFKDGILKVCVPKKGIEEAEQVKLITID